MSSTDLFLNEEEVAIESGDGWRREGRERRWRERVGGDGAGMKRRTKRDEQRSLRDLGCICIENRVIVIGVRACVRAREETEMDGGGRRWTLGVGL